MEKEIKLKTRFNIKENIDSDKFITHTQKLFLLAMLTNDENMANNQKLLETIDKYDELNYNEFEEKICEILELDNIKINKNMGKQ